MQLPRSLDEGRGGYPKQIVDNIAHRWFEVLCLEHQDTYYRLDQFAEAIARDPKELIDRPTIFHEQPWISRIEADRIIEQRRTDRHERIRARLPRPTLKRDAVEQSAKILIDNLRKRLDKEKQSTEARIQAVREKRDEERVAKERFALDKNELSQWLDKAQGALDKARSENHRLLEESSSDDNAIRAELEDAKQRSREVSEENENLRAEL